MKKYVCEVCGSTSMKKIDETTWECQDCGLLYTNDEIQIVDITEAETINTGGTSSQTSGFSAPRRIPSLSINSEDDISNIIKRAFMFIEDGDWDSADAYLEAVLDKSPENADAYLGKLLVAQRVNSKEELADCGSTFENNPNYNKIIRFGNDDIKAYLRDCNKEIIYRQARKKAENASSEADYHAAADAFEPILNYKDSKELQKKCIELAIKAKEDAEEARNNSIYIQAIDKMNNASNKAEYEEAAAAFEPVLDYKDAKELQAKCIQSIQEIENNSIYSKALELRSKNSIKKLEEAIAVFETIKDWKDSEQHIDYCKKRIIEIKQEKAEKEQQEREQEEQKIIAKKRKKKKAIIGVVILLFLCALAVVYVFLIMPLTKYNKAINLYSQSNYKDASKILSTITNYKDSLDLLNDCYLKLAEASLSAQSYKEAIGYYSQINDYDTSTELYKSACYYYAKSLFDEKNYTEAVKYFEQCNGWNDSKEQINESKYQYICLNKNNTDEKTSQFLSELYALDYKDSRSIYNELYSWKTTIVFNSSENDTTTDYQSTDKSNNWYFHISLSGGKSNEAIRMSYKIKHPNGEEKEKSFDSIWESGSSGYIKGQSGSAGTLSLTLYDESGKIIGEKSVLITDINSNKTNNSGGSYYKVKTNGDNLNLRSGPSVSSDIIAKIPNNSTVEVLPYGGEEASSEWTYVNYNGILGFVSSKYIDWN